MKNTIATIILGIAVLFIGAALLFHVWGTEHKAEQSIESTAIEAVVDSTLWSDFSHPDTLFSYSDYDSSTALMYTYHSNGLLALGEYRYVKKDDKKLRRYIGFWNETGSLVAIRDFDPDSKQPNNHWLCIKMTKKHAFYAALQDAYDISGDTYFEGLPTKNPESCPER